jgi:RNA polymerase sigma-70 factor (sigma-E family)
VKRHGAQEEFERFVTSTGGDLLRTGYLVVGDLTSAEDLVQECLFRVARRWPRVRSMEYPVAYARKILVNLALDGAERRGRHRSELDPRHGPVMESRHDESTARALGAVETSSVLIDAMGTLAPRQRAALVLRYFDDLSEAQVAEAMDCSVGTVKSTTSRALDRLHHVLVPVFTGEDLLQSPHLTDTKGVNDDDQPTRI